MNIVELVRSLYPNFEPIDVGDFTESRRQQYKRIFGEDFIDFVDKKYEAFESDKQKAATNVGQMSKDYSTGIVEKILMFNPQLNNNFQIEFINSDSESTRSYSFSQGNIILLDQNSMVFLWMLNKVFFSSIEFDTMRNLDYAEQQNLYVRILLHYFSRKHPYATRHVFRRPETPPHQGKEQLFMLTNATLIQEEFIVAHEIGHLCGAKEISDIYSEEVRSILLSYSIMDETAICEVCEEIAADFFAFDAVLNVYKHRGPLEIIAQFVAQAIFLVIRYFLWYTLLETKESDLTNMDFLVWFCRNSCFRHYVEDFLHEYTSLQGHCFIWVLDELEKAFEPACLCAKQIIHALYGVK